MIRLLNTEERLKSVLDNANKNITKVNFLNDEIKKHQLQLDNYISTYRKNDEEDWVLEDLIQDTKIRLEIYKNELKRIEGDEFEV